MAIKGHAGSVTVGTAMGNAKAWTINMNADTVDVTDFSSNGWKENEATLKSFDGSITAIFEGGNAQEDSLFASLTGGSTVSIQCDLDEATNDKATYSGDVLVTGIPVTNDVNGVVEVTFSFVGTGALTVS